jgi:hypothetical protein
MVELPKMPSKSTGAGLTALPLMPKKKDDTALSGRIDSTVGKSELAEDNSAWYDWDNIKKSGTNLVNFGKGLGQEIPSEVTRMMGDMISSFGLTVDLGARYSSAGINYLMGDKKQAQKDIDSDPTFLTKYLIDAGNYLSENADKTKDDTLKNWGVSDKNRNPQRSFYDAFSDGDLGDGSAMLFRDVLATVPQVVAATLTGGGSLEAQALRTSGGLLKQTALSEIGAIASSELPAILSTGLKSQTGAQFKFGLGLGTSSSLAGEYKKDNHVTATDFLESIARGVVEGASESLFDTDILAAKKLASRFVNVSDNPAIRGIMASIADEGEDAAREKIVRTTTDILGKAFAGGRNEGLEEVASSFGNMLIDVTKQGGFTMDSLDKFKKEAVESFIVGSLSGGLISGGAARMSRVKLTDVQQKTIDRYNEVVNDESLSDDARNIAKSRIKDILDYNASLSKENYGLIAALPKEKRTEALEYLSKMNQLEDDIKSAKDLAPDIEAQIKSYEDKVNNLIDEEYKAQREERRRKTMSQSEIDTEDIVNMFQTIQPEGISIEDMDSAINEVRNKVNGKEEVDQEDINSANDMLYEILDKIEKSELTSEQKKVASEPFFNQIEQLQSYDKIIKTTEVTTPIQEVTRTTRETGRVERPKTTVMTDRFNLEPVEVTDSEGAKSNYVARVDENGGISLVPKVKFSRTAKEQKRKTIELDSNLLQFQESIKDENDRVIGAKLLDRKTGNIIEISNPELAIDLATRAKQETLGNVSEGLMQQETTVKPIGEMTSIVKEFVNKRTTAQAPVQEVALEETEEQTSLTTEMPSSPVGLPSRKAYVVAADIINKMGNRILNKVSPENKARISNYVKAAKSLMPDLNVVLYDNKADMIQGLVNQGNSLEDATKAVNESKGLFSQMGNTIHIDVTRMDKETLAHEIFHPLVSRLADENPAEFTEMRNRISKVLSGSDLAALDRFAKMYAEDGVDVSAEEFLAQLAALVTTNKVKFKRGEVQKIAMAIKEFIKKIAKKINSKQLSDFADSFFNENTKTEELIKFFEGYGRSLRQGAEINVEALNLPAEGFIAPEGNLRQQKITSVKNIDVKEVRTLSRAGNRVSKGLSVSTKDGKKVVQEAEDLSLEYVKANAPELFIANANIIANYPLVSGILNKGNIASIEDAQEVYDVFSREIANNLEYLMDNFNQNYKDVSTLWYDGANILAQDLSKKYGVTTEQVAGIIASLSPQKDWYQNVRLAEMVLMAHEANPVMSKEMVDKQRLIAQEGLKPSLKALNQAKKSYKDSKTKANKEKLDAAKEKYDSNVSNSNKLIDAISELVGKNMNDVPNEMKGYYIRLWNEVNTTKDYNILSPDGQVMGLAAKNNGEKAKVAWGSYTEINKANAIYLDGSQENITRSLGEMHKIRNFYNNIIDPMSKDQDVTMDTHAIAAALLMPLSGNSTQVGQNFGTGTKNSSPLGIKGLYYAYAEGYKLAAKETDLLPRQVQSITWEAIRGLFTATFKNSKQNVAKIESIWDNYANNKISIDETRKQIDEFSGGIKDPTWARPIQEGVAENIEEGAIGRGVDGARQGDVGESARDRLRQQKSYPDALAESRKEYADKNKNSFKEVSRYIRKLIFERNINIKKAMQDAELEFSLYTMYNKAGASMFGNLKFTETFNEIYGDLSQEEIKLLDNFVFLRRVVAIDTNFDNRKEDRPKHTAHNNIDGINTVTTKESALSTLEDYKDLLGDELYDKVYSASDKYFNAFSNILKYKYENGLISKDTYELYKDYNYSPRKFLKFVFGNSIGEEALSPNNFYQRGLSLSANEIKNIKDGADTGILVDSVKLLHAAMIATEVRVASNLALKTLYQEAIPQNLDFVKEVEYETDANGTIKVNEDGSLKYKTKADDGFRIVTFKDNGIVSAFQLREDLAKEYFDEELFDKNSKAYKAAQLATGANILRNMATGMNLAFPITNIPVDVISQVQLNNIYDGAGVGVAGQYTKALAGTISNSLKLIPLEFGKSNQEIEDLIYEYGKAGGLMMSMSQEYAAKDKFFGAMAKYLGAFGNASEMASKLTAYKTVKEAEIAKFKSANNGAMPIGSDMTKIQTKAAYIARAAMDYHRGGLLTKWIDGFVPYLNVFSQGSKITIDYIRNNPKAFTDKIVQTGLFVAALTIYNMAVAGSDYDNDDNEQDLATKIVVFLPFKNADGTRGKIEIGAPAPVKGFLNIFQNMGEGIYHQIIAQDEQRYDAWKAKVNAKFVNMFSTNLATNIPPALKSLIEYSYNLDLWRGGKVYEKMGEVLPQDEGRYDKNVAEFYKVLGSAIGKSPKRMQKAAENFITQSNPLVGVGYSLMDKMINQYQSLPESQRSKFDTGKISDIPVSLFDKISGRIYSVTDPKVTFKKNSDVIDKINQEAGSKKMEVKAEMKLLIEKKASTEEMNAYLIKQDPIYRRAARDYAILLKKESLLKYPTNKDEYFDIMLGANAEAKAQIIYAYFPHLLMEGNQDLRHDLSMLNLFGEDTKRIFNGYHKNKGIPK